MSEWFRGDLEGYYVGMPVGAVAEGPARAGNTRFTLRIYRATVTNVSLCDASAVSCLEQTRQPHLSQPEITNVRIVGLRDRVLSGSVYDTLIASPEIKPLARREGKTYGRVRGQVIGRCVLPQAEVGEMAPLAEEALPKLPERIATGDAISVESEDAPADGPASAMPARLERAASERPLTAQPGRREDAGPRVPFVFLTVVLALALAMLGGGMAAAGWLAVMVPILMVRFLLGGSFSAARWHRTFAAILVGAQLACFVVIALQWWQDGCAGVALWPLVLIPAMAFVSSFLPSPFPLLCTQTCFAAMLFVWFAGMGPCEGPSASTPPTSVDEPSVGDPGSPRTNADGSWPRRPPPLRTQ